MKTTILFAVLLASAAFAKPQPGLPFLLIWPTARSTALAGAMTGLADDPDAAFFNPAGLALQSGIGATVTCADWLPGLYPGMSYAFAAGDVKLSKRVCVGLSATQFEQGEVDMNWLEGASYPDAWRRTLACVVAVGLSDQVALSVTAKYIRSYLVPDWVWMSMPGLGIEAGGTGSTGAADVGALWKPSTRFSLGGCLANLGPGITYTSSGEHDPSPTILRIGACWMPVSNRYVRVNVLPEFDKVLVGMFFDTADTKTFREELQTELRDAWKAVGVEVTALQFLTARVGYFEDMAWNRGGILFERKHEVYRHNIYDVLTRKGLGRIESVGLCWGFGIGYKDYFRFDISSDAAPRMPRGLRKF